MAENSADSQMQCGNDGRPAGQPCEDCPVSGFDGGEDQWIQRLGLLRNVIRQEVIARQLSDLVTPGSKVLDVGCGQGTQALKLAAAGCHVTGIDPSEELISRFAAEAQAANADVELIDGTIEELPQLLGARRFDLVCAHGLMMYLDDHAQAIAMLSTFVDRGGLMSFTVRNAHSLAMRPGLRRDWSGAVMALESDQYVNELGLTAFADRLEDVTRHLSEIEFQIVAWYGVRVFTDAVPNGTPVPGRGELRRLIDAEDKAGRIDPYRWMGSQIHVIAEQRP